MNTSLSHPSPPTLSLLIICKNNYLNIGMTNLVNNLQPMIFHKTGKLCDIKTFNTPDELDMDKLSKNTEHCLVIERDSFRHFHDLLLARNCQATFNNVFFLSTGGCSFTSQINFLPCKPDLNFIKKTLFRIMTTDYGASLETLHNHTRNLTPEDKQLLRLIIAEHSVSEIATRLNISTQAVYASRSRLFAKLGVSNINELLTCGAIMGL
ncbi:TPA: helix-turn-helix transcriptional regulator [Enterobacter cancerogenus]|nr:helix-turn-helix transcriptional regulator [Enterobacter cancerogenus]